MNNEEWNKYVSKVAKTIKVPSSEYDAIIVPSNWKTTAKPRYKKTKAPVVILPVGYIPPKVKVATKPKAVKPSYTIMKYTYKGKTYKRKIVA